MSTATGAKVRKTYVEEVTFGTTPGTPAMVEVPFISSGLNLTKAFLEDPSIQSDRQEHFGRHGNRSTAGDISFAYTYGNFDAFLESVLMSAWSTDVLKVGSTQKSFSIEVGHTDIDQYLVYTGVVMDGLSLEVNLDGVVQSTFSVLGKNMTVSGSELDATPTEAGSYEPFVHFEGTFKEGGSTVADLTGISLSVSNNSAGNWALGDATVKSISEGKCKVSGTVTAFFEDATYLNKFLNETASSIEFTLTDPAGNSHTFLIPNVKYNGGGTPVNGDGPIYIELPFVGLYDDTEATSIKVTRAAA